MYTYLFHCPEVCVLRFFFVSFNFFEYSLLLNMSLTAFTKSRKYLVSATPTYYKLFELVDNALSVSNVFRQVAQHQMVGTMRIHMIADIMDDLQGLIVLKGYENQLLLWDFVNKRVEYAFNYNRTILLANMSPNIIVVLDSKKITIHDHTGKDMLKIRLDRPMFDMFSVWGAFVYTESDSFLALPKKRFSRNKILSQVVIINARTKRVFRLKRRTEVDIVVMAFSPSGELLAIAVELEHYLNIGVYNWRNNQLLHKCLHDDQSINIRSLFFSDCDSYIAANSDVNEVFVYHLSTTNQRSENILYPTSAKVIKVPQGNQPDRAGLEYCVISAQGGDIRFMVALSSNSLYLHYIHNFDADPYESTLFNLVNLAAGGVFLNESFEDSVLSDDAGPSSASGAIRKYRHKGHEDLEEFQLKLRQLEEEALGDSVNSPLSPQTFEEEWVLNVETGFFSKRGPPKFQEELDVSNLSSTNLEDQWIFDSDTEYFRKRSPRKVQREWDEENFSSLSLEDERVLDSNTGFLKKRGPPKEQEEWDRVLLRLRSAQEPNPHKVQGDDESNLNSLKLEYEWIFDPGTGNFTRGPPKEMWVLDPDTGYFINLNPRVPENETIQGSSTETLEEPSPPEFYEGEVDTNLSALNSEEEEYVIDPDTGVRKKRSPHKVKFNVPVRFDEDIRETRGSRLCPRKKRSPQEDQEEIDNADVGGAENFSAAAGFYDGAGPFEAAGTSDAAAISDAAGTSDAAGPFDASGPSYATGPYDASGPSDASEPSYAAEPSYAGEYSDPERSTIDPKVSMNLQQEQMNYGSSAAVAAKLSDTAGASASGELSDSAEHSHTDETIGERRADSDPEKPSGSGEHCDTARIVREPSAPMGLQQGMLRYAHGPSDPERYSDDGESTASMNLQMGMRGDFGTAIYRPSLSRLHVDTVRVIRERRSLMYLRQEMREGESDSGSSSDTQSEAVEHSDTTASSSITSAIKNVVDDQCSRLS